MTLIIAAEGIDFIIAGSDSLGTFGGDSGTNVCEESDKCFQVSDHVSILISGDGDIAYQIIEEFKKSINGQNIDGVSNITKKFIEFGRENINHLKNLPLPSECFPSCTFIIAGLDEEGGIYKTPKTYITCSYDNFILRGDALGYKIGGKPMIARYLFRKYYEKDMSADDLASLVMGALYDVSEIARDGGVGGDLNIIKIGSDGIISFDDHARETFKIRWIETTKKGSNKMPPG